MAEEIKPEVIQEIKQNLHNEMTELSTLSLGVHDMAKQFERMDEYGSFALLDSLYVAMSKRLENLDELISSMPGRY